MASIETADFEWTRVLKPGAHAFIVIGNAIVGGTRHWTISARMPMSKLIINGTPLLHSLSTESGEGQKSFNQQARIKQEHLLLFAK